MNNYADAQSAINELFKAIQDSKADYGDGAFPYATGYLLSEFASVITNLSKKENAKVIANLKASAARQK